jgi:hypothetical protein
MKVLSPLLALLGLLAFASAVDVMKSVIVSYPMSTPDHIVDQAKQAIEDAGGQITHTYQFIKYVDPGISQQINTLPSSPIPQSRECTDAVAIC